MNCINKAFSFFNEFDNYSFKLEIWALTSDKLSTLYEISTTAFTSALKTSTSAALIIDIHTIRDFSQDKNQLYKRVKYLKQYVFRFF